MSSLRLGRRSHTAFACGPYVSQNLFRKIGPQMQIIWPVVGSDNGRPA